MAGQLRVSKWDHDEVDDGDEERAGAARERLFDATSSTPAKPTLTPTATPDPPAAQPRRAAPRRARQTTAQAGGRATAAGKPAPVPATPAAKSPPLPPPARSIASQLPNVNVPTPTLRPRRGDGTGFGFGLILYALGLNFLRHGWPGVTGWLNAKFFNRTMTPEGKP